jgi:hypothetical protein
MTHIYNLMEASLHHLGARSESLPALRHALLLCITGLGDGADEGGSIPPCMRSWIAFSRLSILVDISPTVFGQL